MKSIFYSNALTWLAWAGTITAASPLGTAFTYQGQLRTDTTAATGLFDFRFEVFDAANNGLSIGVPVNLAAVPVSQGGFMVELDFGVGVFDGDARWLAIKVKTNGTPAFTILEPRQRLGPAPGAVFATTAGGLSPAASQTYLLRGGDTMAGNLNLAGNATLNFGTTTRQMLNLWGIDYGIGVQADNLYFRAHNDFAWYRGGTHNDAHLNAGDGQRLMFLTTNGLEVGGTVAGLRLTASDSANNSTNVASTATGDNSTAVLGKTYAMVRLRPEVAPIQFGDTPGSVAVQGQASQGTGVLGQSMTGVGVIGQLGTGSHSGFQSAMLGISFDSSGNGVIGEADKGNNARGVWGRSAEGYGGYFEGGFGGVYGASAAGHSGWFKGNVRIEDNSTLSRPHLQLHEYESGDFARLRLSAQSHPFWDIAAGGGANDLNFYNSTNGDVMTLKENGNLLVRVLTITGGADLAEPFQMSEKDLPKGAVVVIDENQPGRLKLSSEPYDTRVAGVISGANGINPGLSLSQQGLVDGDQPVALTGRLYVQADASRGAIKPGDLLTTANRPGHAMKATDPGRAQGAILGKAMSSLKEGTGLVLVLVTLQ